MGSVERTKGKSAVAHVRYATAGGSGYENVQPLVFNLKLEVLRLHIMET